MLQLALFAGAAAACAHLALALTLPSSSSSTSPHPDLDPLAALFSAHGHWVDAHNTSSTWTPSDADASTFRRAEHRWHPDALPSSSSSDGLVRLSRPDILSCLAGETVTIWGDSTARVLYYGCARPPSLPLVDSARPGSHELTSPSRRARRLINKLEPTAVTDKHANRVLAFSPTDDDDDDGDGARASPSSLSLEPPDLPSPRTATFEFRWDPVLGSNSFSGFRPFLSTGRLAPLLPSPSPSSPSLPAPHPRPRPPALLLFSTGLWYLDPRPGMYPLARLAQYQLDIRALLALAARVRLARAGLVLAEVERPVEAKDQDRGGRNWHDAGEVEEANEWLRGEVERWRVREGRKARTRVVVGASSHFSPSPSLPPFPPSLFLPRSPSPSLSPSLPSLSPFRRALAPDALQPARTGSVFNAQIAHLSANTPDGLHYDLALAEEMADVVLHALCALPAPPLRSAGAPHRGAQGVCVECARRAGGAAALGALGLGALVWLARTGKLSLGALLLLPLPPSRAPRTLALELEPP